MPDAKGDYINSNSNEDGLKVDSQTSEVGHPVGTVQANRMADLPERRMILSKV